MSERVGLDAVLASFQSSQLKRDTDGAERWVLGTTGRPASSNWRSIADQRPPPAVIIAARLGGLGAFGHGSRIRSAIDALSPCQLTALQAEWL